MANFQQYVYPPTQEQSYDVYPPPQSYPDVYPPRATKQQAFFAPGTDPEIIRAFRAYDEDGNGLIDDEELQKALSTADLSYSIRTVRLLMFKYNSNCTRIGPKEFTTLWHDLQAWRSIFEKFDRDRSGTIDNMELRDALRQLGLAVSQPVLQLLLTKYDRTGEDSGIDYDNFIECGIIVKGLTQKFKEKDKRRSGAATLTYEDFMLTVLPFIVA
ncbi:calcium-binding protein CBP isoform X2 [Cryptomeria japonica]|uniref:calcium-binding protein CBP isoform X2 n=1 Tax=Cryptomeria japonica TaxID=3369 RepID=UPI0025ABCA19|nr:calcium-binding protein CBP isoform X2 [Cryptomeria japonica]